MLSERSSQLQKLGEIWDKGGKNCVDCIAEYSQCFQCNGTGVFKTIAKKQKTFRELMAEQYEKIVSRQKGEKDARKDK